MQWFDYARPPRLEEALDLLANPEARPLAGGTDLLVQLRSRRRSAKLVVDLKEIPELNLIEYSPASGLRLGAAVPCYRIYRDAAVSRAYAGLQDVAGLIGGTQIQGRASIGGNLVNAAPSADAVPVLIAYRVTCHIAGPRGQRTVSAEEFCTGPGKTVLEPGEILILLEFPPPRNGFAAAYLRFIPRNEMDIAVAGAGVSLQLSNGAIESARVALAAVAPRPLYVAACGAALEGKAPGEEAFRHAGEIASQAASPITDMRGPAAYRRHLCSVLTRRALAIALDRARGAN